MNPAANPPHYPFQDDPFDWHPYAEIFPMMSEEEIEELANDIEANGQLNPIQIYDGKILDGRNRYAALEFLNHRRSVDSKPPMPLTYGVFLKEVNPINDARALAFVRSHNLMRRNMHMTTGQKAALAVKFENYYAEIAKREEAWRKSRQNVEHEDSRTLVNSLKSPIHAAKEAAKEIGIGSQSVIRAKAIQQADPELFKALDDGKISVNKAYNQIKPHKQKEPDQPIEEESDPKTIEITSEEIIISFVSNIESLFPDEIQYCLNEIYNRRRDAVKEFIANLKITDPLLFN